MPLIDQIAKVALVLCYGLIQNIEAVVYVSTTAIGRCVYFVAKLGHVTPGSLAEKSGLFTGDHLLAVNHLDVSNMDHGDIVHLIQQSGQTIHLQVHLPSGMLLMLCDKGNRKMIGKFMLQILTVHFSENNFGLSLHEFQKK